MTNFFEALQQERAKGDGGSEAMIAAEKGVLRPTPPAMEARMLDLYQSLAARLRNDRGFVAMLIACDAREGGAVVSRELAKVAAVRAGRTVLLLDANHRSPQQLKAFNIHPAGGWEESVRGTRDESEVIHRVADFSLWVGQVSIGRSAAPPVYESPRFAESLDELRKRFDVVLIDAPPANEGAEGLSLARHADGVVLVVEAERTRWQVADRLKTRIAEQGGNLLGVVLNKRRHTIPGFLYKRL